jgi:hypothetical protein
MDSAAHFHLYLELPARLPAYFTNNSIIEIKASEKRTDI